MPRVTTNFGGGGGVTSTLGREGLDIGAVPNFWKDLENLNKVLKPKKATTPKAQGAALARGSGGGQYARSAPAPDFSGDFSGGTGSDGGAHSFVQNMWGPNQVSGYVATGFGPRAVYGGWDPTGGMKGGVTVDPRVPEYQRQFPSPPDIDPAVRASALNSSLGPSLADLQRSERLSSSREPYAPTKGKPSSRAGRGSGGGR